MEPRVLLLSSRFTFDRAQEVKAAIEDAGYSVNFTAMENSAQHIRQMVHHNLDPGQFLIVLLDKHSLNSDWLMAAFERELLKSELEHRSISVVLLATDRTRIPEFLHNYYTIDLSRAWRRGLLRLSNRLRLARSVDFRQLPPPLFEKLVLELLKSYGFRRFRPIGAGSFGLDMLARHDSKDPFGRPFPETWAVRVKLSIGQGDIRALREFIGQLVSHGEPIRGLFVTSGSLTSAARHYLADLRPNPFLQLRVIEGDELLQLVISRPRIAAKYFAPLIGGSNNAHPN